MIAVSSLLRRAVYPVMSHAGLFSRRVRAGAVGVVTYHGVMPKGWTAGVSPIEGTLVSADQFHRQVRFLKSRYSLITPEAFHAWAKGQGVLPVGAVLLTCDDGLLNALTDMVPILVEEGARCLFFVTGASLEDTAQSLWYEELYRMLSDAPGDAPLAVASRSARKDSLTEKELVECWWELVQELSAGNGMDRKEALRSLQSKWRLPGDWRMYDPGDVGAGRRYRLLNRAELDELVSLGMTVGAHTMSHPYLAKMPAELVEREVQDCKAGLEALLKKEVWALAYPFGQESSAGVREMTIAARAGYACAFYNCGGGLSRQTNLRFGLPRVHVTAKMSLPELEAHLSGFHEALQRRFRGTSGSLLCA